MFSNFYMWSKKELDIYPSLKSMDKMNRDRFNNKVKIPKFGTFIIRHKKSRIGRNPKTKENKVIASRKVVLFKPSKELKNKINKYNE